ncbi:MAG: WecB/TagA/CpsF family glycosyltransferase [Patescibacteria group bacterium]
MEEVYILGSKINDISLNEAIGEIANFLLTGKKSYLVTPNPEICLVGYKDKQFRRIIQNSFISIPDGFGLKLGARIFGQKLFNITTGADLCWEVLKLAEHKNYSILFFEGRPQIGDRALNVISQKYPNLKIKFLDPGKVDKQGNFENPNLIKQINEFHPDIILVNFGPPKQEYFISKNIEKIDTKLMLGIGGSLDFISGRLNRAPESWRKLGIEWLWRLIQEPWRWKRIIKAVIIFPLACLGWRFGSTFIYRKNVAAFIINNNKQILITQHSKYGGWVLPQGGAKNAKTKDKLEEAVRREMKEELGTDKFQIVKMLKNCYKYKWQKDKNYIDIDKFKGQKQTLFLLKFTGQDTDIKLDLHEHTEWQWIDKNKILEKVSPRRKKLVQIGLDKFKEYL